MHTIACVEWHRELWQVGWVVARPRRMARRVGYLLAACALPLLLFSLDRWVSDRGTLGWERNAVRGGLARVDKLPEASGVVVLGSSTSRDWLRMRALAFLYRIPRDQVVDAHINGCHQACTWAEVRNMLARGRHFEYAFYGLNHFQMCEEPHSKRVLQHRMLLPREQTFDLWKLYAHAKMPQWYIARSIVAAGAQGPADTAAVRAKLRYYTVGRPQPGQSHRWSTANPPSPPRVRYCSYNEDEVRYKLEATRMLFDDLKHLATVSNVMILPDESLSHTTPAITKAWAAHRKALHELAASRPWIELIDMTEGGPWTPERFTDGVHLHQHEYGGQRRRLSHAVLRSMRRRARAE